MLLFELTKDTPYLALSGELWSVFYEYFNRNWSCYKGFLLYNKGQYNVTLHTPQQWQTCNTNHGDVIKWKHFPCYWPSVRGVHWSLVKRASDAELWCFLWSAPEQTIEQNSWANNRDTSDLWCYWTHHDVTVMQTLNSQEAPCSHGWTMVNYKVGSFFS